MKFRYILGNNFTETFQMLIQSNAKIYMSTKQCYEWFKRFQEGRASVDEVPRPGRHSTSTDDGHVQMVRHVIRANRRLTVREVAEEVDISVGSCHQILTEKLQMRRVSAKFVPRLLTNDQKENRVQISQELLTNASGNYNFLKNIITGDETWVYGYDVETKMQSSQWVGKGSPRPKKARMCRSKIKVMLTVFFYWKGIVHHEFVPAGQMVNQHLYVKVLTRLREAVRRKRPVLWTNKIWMLHHDNAPAHSVLLILNYLAKHQTSIVPHPPYSPDLAQADFFSISKLKTPLKGRRFLTIETIQENATKGLHSITENAFQEAFQQWQKRWERCIDSSEDYFEGDSA